MASGVLAHYGPIAGYCRSRRIPVMLHCHSFGDIHWQSGQLGLVWALRKLFRLMQRAHGSPTRQNTAYDWMIYTESSGAVQYFANSSVVVSNFTSTVAWEPA